MSLSAIERAATVCIALTGCTAVGLPIDRANPAADASALSSADLAAPSGPDLGTRILDFAQSADAPDLGSIADMTSPRDLACAANVQNDPQNCGTCGHSCLGGACSYGACQPILLSAIGDNPTHLALSGDFVYWTDDKAFAVMKSPASGGPSTVLADNQGYLMTIATDGIDVFWTAQLPAPDDSGVMTTTVDGGPVATLATGFYNPIALAVGDDAAYVDDAIHLWKAPRDGSAAYSLTTVNGTGNRIWVDATHVYFNDCAYSGCTGYRMPRDGSQAPAVVSAFFETVDDISVFFADPNPGGTLFRKDKNATTSAPILRMPQPSVIVANGDELFDLAGYGGTTATVSRAPTGGGVLATMATVPALNALDIVADAKRVAFIAGNQLWAVAR